MTDGHADCAYWGLTRLQCMRYHGRVARYWGRRSRVSADKAMRLSAMSLRSAYVALALLAFALLCQVIAAIGLAIQGMSD